MWLRTDDMLINLDRVEKIEVDGADITFTFPDSGDGEPNVTEVLSEANETDAKALLDRLTNNLKYGKPYVTTA